MKFLRMFKQKKFENICGFDGVKDIIRRVLDCEENFNLLLIGQPSSAKTLFLLGIIEARKGVYFDVYNQSVDMLDKQTPKIICIDDLDKMSTDFQNHLLNFLENGHIKDRSFHFEIQNCKVFATCTDISGLSKSMQSRFRRLHLAAYTEEQFLDVAVRVLPKLQETTARKIGEQVWNQGNKDVRDIIKIGKLLRNIEREQMGHVLRP
jgi:ATPase family associated with various cellular activities (AAA)